MGKREEKNLHDYQGPFEAHGKGTNSCFLFEMKKWKWKKVHKNQVVILHIMKHMKIS